MQPAAFFKHPEVFSEGGDLDRIVHLQACFHPTTDDVVKENQAESIAPAQHHHGLAARPEGHVHRVHRSALPGFGFVRGYSLQLLPVPPGAGPRVGILNNGAVTLTSDGNLNVFAAPVNTATGPQPSGVLASSGAVDLGDANLYLTFAQANLRPGQTFEIITGTSVTGTLKVGGLTVFDGDTFEAGSYLFQINYTATSVVITVLGVV